MYRKMGKDSLLVVAMSVTSLGVALPWSARPTAARRNGSQGRRKARRIGPRHQKILWTPKTRSARDLTETGDTVRDGFARTANPSRAWGSFRESTEGFTGTRRCTRASFLVKADGGGTVTIRGTVPDDAAKAKAISLVKDTFGVTRVVVQLRVVAPRPRDRNQSQTTADPRTTTETHRYAQDPRSNRGTDND